MVLNKTKTARKRAITIYAPSEKIKENWYALAKKHGMSVSNYVFDIVENHIQNENEFTTRRDLVLKIRDTEKQGSTYVKHIERLQSENAELQKKIDLLNMLADRYEKQLQEYRNKTFIENGTFEGVREFEQKLIEIFKKKSSIAEDEIIDLLHISPKDVDTLKAISRQVELLEEYGVIEKIRGGWRWRK